MSPEIIAALMFICFLAGCLFCWPLAYRSGKLKAARQSDLDAYEEEWWNL